MIEPVAGVLLAGGLARRMGGGDKCLRMLGGESILDRIVGRVRPQVDALVLNANGDASRFAATGLPVTPDTIEGFAGPLAGVLAGMEWAREHAPACAWLVSIPTDAPFLPLDFVARLWTALQEDEAEMACAASGGRMHPVIGLWPVGLADDLRHAMIDEEIRKVDIWTGRYRLATVEFSTDPYDPFFNANRPADLEAAERLLAGLG